MLDDFISLWPWLVASIGVGAATAAFAGRGAGRRIPARWLVWFVAAASAGVVAVALGAIKDDAARVVTVGVACFVAFLAGASAIGAARGALGARERWALGLVPLALLWWGALVLSPREVNPPNFHLLGPAPIQEGQAGLPEKNADQTGVIPAPSAAASDPTARLAALPTGDLDAETCQRALDAVAAAEPVSFNPTHATIHRRASSALDRAAEVIRRCPEASVEVIGFDDGAGANAALALRRARAAERYLRAEGVGGRRLASRAADSRAARPGQGLIGYALRRAKADP